ncbi:MotA/TolQ/ExbB proton channel family protein [Spongiibacter sp.]|uniref:MotA/TolQ/ExbB proton channel family protein n=1 Tax=Spongiibacter sp. TaxID=2024860 RepID=UPI003564117D
MLSSLSLGLMHQLTSWLLEPVVWSLLGFVVLAVYESGLAIGERCGGIARLLARGDTSRLKAAGRRRIERADFITRLAPMLGLMGTLIPLGPGLAALGEGELSILTTAMIVAFDTTVVGLLVGMVGFVLGRLRRRWYDAALEALAARQLQADYQQLAGLKSAPRRAVDSVNCDG